jgi:apolipoprotein N-acyltransferase
MGGFGWALLAHSQSKALAVIQIADITGAYGTSFLVMLVNTALYMTIKDIRDRKNHAMPFLVVTVIVLYASVVYGTVRLKNIFTGENLKVAVVQGNIPQNEKWDPDFKVKILDKYENLTKEAGKDGPDLIIWPETSVPGFLDYERDINDRIKNLAVSTETHILVGAPSAEGNWDRLYNSAVLFSGEGRVVDRYDKVHLVPFGEYVPFKKIFSFVERFAKSPIGDFSPGRKFTVFKFFIERKSERGGAAWKLLKKAKFSCLICFEDIFPDLTRQFVKNGAGFLVNITNDAWFGDSGAPHQHAQCSVFRAVENRVNVIRAANTGLSCFIDQKGRVVAMAGSGGKHIFVDGVSTHDITLTPTRTFYTVYGDVFVFLAMLYTALCVFFRKGKGAKESAVNPSRY